MTPTQDITHCFANAQRDGLRLLFKRDDLLHPILSGNKWRKLVGLKHRLTQGQQIFTMGGPWSNHIHATAYMAHLHKWPLTLFVRGINTQTITVQECRQWGAKIVPVTRQLFRRLRQTIVLTNGFWLPEGGSGPWNQQGLAELAGELPPTDWLALAVGSGGTLTNLLPHLPPTTRVIAVCVGMQPVHYQTKFNVGDRVIWLANADGSRFGQMNSTIAATIERVWRRYKILLDPIYTAKLWLTIEHLIDQNFFKPSQTITLLHTGGQQGLRGFAHQYPKWLLWYERWQTNQFVFSH